MASKVLVSIFKIPFSSSNIEVSSETDVEGIVLRERVQTIEEFLVSFKRYDPRAPPARVVVGFAEIAGLHEFKLAPQVVAYAEPVH